MKTYLNTFFTDIVGVKSEATQNVPPWHEDYFQLKTTEAQQTQEEFFPSPYLPTEIQIGKPASGREPEHNHFSTYE